MDRDRQMKKDMENKKWQAREDYAKNKPLLSESKIHEKSNDYINPNEIDSEKMNRNTEELEDKRF